MKTHNPSQGLVAVITGTIRQAWSSASEEDKHIFEAAVKDVLEPLPAPPLVLTAAEVYRNFVSTGGVELNIQRTVTEPN